MYFERNEFIIIHGIRYDVSNSAQVDHYKCRETLQAIWNLADSEAIADYQKENYAQNKKELIRQLKEFDKLYVKHGKKGGTNEELMNNVILARMKPLLDLMDSNLNYYKINLMIAAKKAVPDFRFVALREKFCEHMTDLMIILRDYGKLRDFFDIR